MDPNAAARQFALTLSEDELCQQTFGRYYPFLAYPPERPVVFVKFGGPEKQAEADMQRLAWEWLRQQRERDPGCNIYVPEVFKVFSRDNATFIIMELLAATQVKDLAKRFDPITWKQNKAQYYDMITEGIRLLSLIPVPPDATPGPYTHAERYIKHMLFKDHEAPHIYNTVQDLEDHLNRIAVVAYQHLPGPPPKVALEKELVYCYTDFNDENFMFTTDPDGRPRLYIIDFEHASFLPLSFLSYAVLGRKPRFFTGKWIREKLGPSLPQNNIEVMQRIDYLFQIGLED
ncbi:547f5ec2-af15-4178-bc54-79792bc5304f [Thermothielavioides terrestris]|uniref:547f5ec2-af15-4178-bc54-79792bc5304f n=1 Tax=Thermothielavioides terrestris TaxID=2587410 RepID=A0A446BFW1_9PEZI|nr:547f5ec2-af15-4178-bc54-79792bc5304f [Thermothielavioides terrestris]